MCVEVKKKIQDVFMVVKFWLNFLFNFEVKFFISCLEFGIFRVGKRDNYY